VRPTLVVASRNQKKAQEMVALLQPCGVRLRSLADLPDAPHVEETGTTFAENALLKASQVARATGHWALADDSGLEVDALGGAPGVRSARYAGPNASDADNRIQLLRELRGVPAAERGGRFVCHLAVADATGQSRVQVEAYCRGVIVDSERGQHGFGYDPLFLIPEYGRTFGELGPAVKSLISHRARAFRELIAHWRW
jgi:XTP/dITP diphosphohydrolase